MLTHCSCSHLYSTDNGSSMFFAIDPPGIAPHNESPCTSRTPGTVRGALLVHVSTPFNCAFSCPAITKVIPCPGRRSPYVTLAVTPTTAPTTGIWPPQVHPGTQFSDAKKEMWKTEGKQKKKLRLMYYAVSFYVTLGALRLPCKAHSSSV